MLDLPPLADSNTLDIVTTSNLMRIRQLTQISLFEANQTGGMQLLLHLDILPRIQKILIDFFENMDGLKKQTEIKFDLEDKELILFSIPDIKNFLPKIEEKFSKVPEIRLQKFIQACKKLNIIKKLNYSQLVEINSLQQEEKFSLAKEKIIKLLTNIQSGFAVVADLLFATGLTAALENTAIEAAESFYNSIKADFLLAVDDKMLFSDYSQHIFNGLYNMRKENFLLNKYVGLPKYFEFSKLILEQLTKILLQRLITNHIDFDSSLANKLFIEYHDAINESLPKGPKRQKELLRLHESCFYFYLYQSDFLIVRFHFHIITNKKNMQYILSRLEWDDSDKFLLGIGYGALSMWKRLLENNIMPKSAILSEIKIFIGYLKVYMAKKSAQDRSVILIPIVIHTKDLIQNLEQFRISFQNLLKQFEQLLLGLETPIQIPKKKSPQKQKKTFTPTLEPQLSKLLPALTAPAPLIPLIQAPTFRIPPEQRQADKQRKKKLYLAEQKKELKQARSLNKGNITVKEKIYEIRSKLGHLIYGILCLPPKTSQATINLAISILEKGKLGVKNNQVKFVEKSEIKTMKLPDTVHYKLKGTIPEGSEKGQLVRVYGEKNLETNLIEFSILVRNPHKTDALETSKSDRTLEF